MVWPFAQCALMAGNLMPQHQGQKFGVMQVQQSPKGKSTVVFAPDTCAQQSYFGSAGPPRILVSKLKMFHMLLPLRPLFAQVFNLTRMTWQ